MLFLNVFGENVNGLQFFNFIFKEQQKLKIDLVEN